MKHKTIISNLTLEEKAVLLSGKNEWQTWDIPRLDIPSIFCSDGPHGVRRQEGAGDHLGLNPSVPATCFPTAATVANSWDEKLAEEVGKALGKEAKRLHVDILLGPGLNLKRSPLCGRNFEYFSEDPYLAGKMSAGYIRGIQSEGVYACPKHFAVNNQELHRMSVDAVLDERTLREIYLTGFEIAVKEGKAKSVMTSYNKINGVYANENLFLLKKILREEWGFDGIVITDWGGSNDHVEGVRAGSNLEMPAPGLDSARQIVKAVKEEKLSEEDVDFCVDGILDAVLELSGNKHKVGIQRLDGMAGEQKDGDEAEGKNTKRTEEFWETKHHALARKTAGESAVLLKNENQILPLKKNCRVAVIGDFAEHPRYQGAGSSLVNPTFLENVQHCIGEYELETVGFARGYKRAGERDSALEKEAVSLAGKADVVLYFFGLDEISEVEGEDRTHMKLRRNQTELLKALFEENENIVGILSGGSTVEMPWASCCKGLLHMYLSGQAGSGAVLDILTGKINPSGKLSETYPVQYEDTPVYRYFPGKERTAEYREGLYIGYRYYDTAQVPVQYPFGYGLSYTTFAYADLQVEKEGISFVITNTGERDGAEIAQMYVSLLDAEVFRPAKELKGFAKVFLKAGESKRVEISFDDKTFRYWNIETKKWEVEGGEYRIIVGASAEDVRLEGTVQVMGTTTENPYEKEELPSYYSGEICQVKDGEFEALLGFPIPEGKWGCNFHINDTISQLYYAKSMLARLVWRILTRMKKKSEAEGKPNLNILFIYNIPFRAIAKMTEGMVSMEMAEGIVTAVNGHFFKGMKTVMGGFFRNRKENKKYEARLAGAETTQSGGKNSVERKVHE